MASCSFPPSFIMLSLSTPPSLRGREILFLYVQPASHPHVWVTRCVLRSDPLQPPPPHFLPALLSHSYTQIRTMTGLLTTHKALKYGSARYVRTNTSCHSLSNSFLIPNSLAECSICQLICFT